jgi:hypothetical protein
MGNEVIFRRTSLGQAQVVQRGSDLPPRMRTLLMLVDGKTSKSRLVQFLPNFGDVEALIEALELSGYITSMPDFLDTNVAIDNEDDAPARPLWERDTQPGEPVAPAAYDGRGGYSGAAAVSRPSASNDIVSAPAIAQQAAPRSQAQNTWQPTAPMPPASAYAAAQQAQQPDLRAAAFDKAATKMQSSGGNLKDALQYANDTLAEIGSLEAIDLMFKLEQCRSTGELSQLLTQIRDLARRAFGPKLADDRVRILERMLG